MLQAAILTIGDEILLGEIQDTNSSWLAERLVETGINPAMRLSIGDEEEAIFAALKFAESRCRLIIITGGLGPTRDDLTKHCLASYFKSPLEENAEALAQLEEKLRRRGREMNELVRTQARHPLKAKLLRNLHGTAPGIWFSENGLNCIALPGVPYEMKQIFSEEVIPELQKLSGGGFIMNRYFRTACIPETKLAQRLEAVENSMPQEIKMAYLPSGGEVKLRLTGRSADEGLLTEKMDLVSAAIRETLAMDIYAEADIPLAAVLAGMLKENDIFLVADDAVIHGKLQDKLREAGVFPEITGSPPAGRKGYKVSFFQEKESSHFAVEIARYQDGIIQEEQLITVPLYSQEEVFRNMLALRAMDMLRRQLLAS
jgi:nicotinamide-nucleotide amidase